MHRFYTLFLAAMLLLSVTSPALAAEFPTIHIIGTIKYILSDNTYGILSDDGKRYQPLKLDKQYRKDGLRVVVDGEIHREIVGTRMWGTAFRIVSIISADKYVSTADKTALGVLCQRMDALNTHDLSKLQSIDVMSRALTAEQLSSWINGYGNFRIRWLETSQPDAKTIEGSYLYSRDLLQGIALSGQTGLSLTRFTLSLLDDCWKFTAAQTVHPDSPMDFNAMLDDLLAQSQTKYGTDDLSKWNLQHSAR